MSIHSVGNCCKTYPLCFFTLQLLSKGPLNSFAILYVFPQSLMLSIAAQRLEQEEVENVKAKENYLNENCPALSLSGGVEELQVMVTVI